ncbi:MAG: flagellar protein FlgN [Nitrosospira sp.]
MTSRVFDPVARIGLERDATQNFIDILRHEQAALQQPDASLLLSIANEKAYQAQQLAQLADARNYWLRELGYTQDHIGMERGLRDFPAAADAWEELLQLAETASQLNKINGILVGQRLRYTQQAISVLQASTHGEPNTRLYCSDGQPQALFGGRQLGEG